MNQTIKYGVFAGIGTIAYYLLFFMSNKEMIFTPAVIWSSIFVSVLCMYLCGKKMSNADGKFQEILRSVFSVWVISELMFYVWYFRFYNADASLAVTQSKVMIDTYQSLLAENQDMARAQDLRGAIADLQKNPLVFTIKDALIAFGRALIGGFGISYAVTWFLDRR